MKFIKAKVHRKIATAFVLLTSIIIFVCTVLIYQSEKVSIQEYSYLELEAIGNTISPYIDGDLHKKVADTYLKRDAFSSQNVPKEYLDLIAPLSLAHEQNRLNTPIYTLVLNKENAQSITKARSVHQSNGMEFIAFSQGIYFRHPYQYKPEMGATLFNGVPTRAAPYADSHGEWISIYLPIKTSKGTIVGIVELDKKMSDLYAENTKALIQLLSILLAVTLGACLIIILVSKRITRSIHALTESAQLFGAGDYLSPITRTTSDEIGLLAKEFEHARGEISGFITRILNVVPGIMLTIDHKGIIQKHASKMTLDLFNKGYDLQGKNIDEVLFSGDPQLQELTSMAFNPAIPVPFDDLIELAPNELNTLVGTFILHYIPIYKEKQLTGIFIFGRDVSKERELSKQMEEENRNNKMLISIIKNRNLFNNYVEESLEGIERAYALLKYDTLSFEEINELFRITHTIKGNGASLNLFELAEFTHEFENKLSLYRENNHIDNVKYVERSYTTIKEMIETLNEQIDELLGIQENYFILQQQEYTSLKSLVRQKNNVDALTLIENIQHPLLNDYVSLKARVVFEQGLELVVGKSAQLKISVEDIRVEQRFIKTLDTILPHLIRNSLDHGLEDEVTREEQEKEHIGTLTISMSRLNNFLQVIVSDDGQGIHPEPVLKKALANKLLTEDEAQQLSEQEIQEYIFAPGFSTVENVSELSGRGVGMDTVKEIIEKQSGTVALISEVGIGTTFTINIPL